MPGVPELAEWLKGVRGEEADLTSYRLSRSLDAQEGVTAPAAGGLFYGERWREAFIGMKDGVLVGEPGTDPEAVVADARLIRARSKEARVSLPAPHMLDLKDDYIGDEEEFSETVAGAYARLAREMRDAGVRGHVLVADTADPIELEVLASRKILFYPRSPGEFDLELLLEYQGDLVLPAKDLSRAPDLMERFRVRRLILLDAREEDLAAATAFADPDMLDVGGYCEDGCPEYWKRLLDRAFVTR
ncbi:hypothetical protein [Methanoculleus caldifontis]|nr:hypothetical protein [Methanoculleus sp. Wushi-C6]